MTGRERIEAAFTPEGADQIGAVICYEGIYVRDHWDQLTSCPWWYEHVPDLEGQMRWRRDVIARTGQDWFQLPTFYPRAVRQALAIEEGPDGAWMVDRRSGQRSALVRPRIGGWAEGREVQSVHPGRLAEDRDEIAARVPPPSKREGTPAHDDGRRDLARAMLREFGGRLYPMRSVSSPLWICYSLWGFEGMMTMIADRPDLVRYACERYLAQGMATVQEAAGAGAAGIWIEECLTDMISPQAFTSLVLPFLRPLVEAIRNSGMHSIYYFCGNPAGKWDQLLDVGADALSLEESKKGFRIDIEDVVERVGGRCVVLGNLDAIHLLPHAEETALRAEIRRQITMGRRNGSRFIMSLGSPVTPGTPVERVRLYCDLCHELGGT